MSLPRSFLRGSVYRRNATDPGLIVWCSGLVKGVARAPEIAEEDMNIMFQTNVTGLINMTQAILPIYKKRPDGGAGDIINIGSIAGLLTPSTLLHLWRIFAVLEKCGRDNHLRRSRAVPRRWNLLRHQGRRPQLH